MSQHLQNARFIARHDPAGNGRLEALQPPQIGYVYTLYILYDIAADSQYDPLGQAAQDRPGGGPGIGQ